MQPERLYDEVHAIMVEEWIRNLGTGPNGVKASLYPEEPYNYYGQRGSVDIAQYFRYKPTDETEYSAVLSIWEIWVKIYSLEEVVRKFKEKVQIFPKYFKQEKQLPVDWVWGCLVFLNSRENVSVILNHIETFRAILTYPEPWDIVQRLLRSRQHGRDSPLLPTPNILILDDPLEPKKSLVFHHKEEPLTEEKLNNSWAYNDAKHFLQEWKKSQV